MADQKRIMTTEEVVNAATERPSLLYMLLMFGLMSIMAVNPMVSFFPAFGGYFPYYGEFRCNLGSARCTERISAMPLAEIGPVPATAAETFFLDSKCSITVTGLAASTEAKIMIMDFNKANVGKIVLNTADGKIEVTSSSACSDQDEVVCQVEVSSVNFGDDLTTSVVVIKFEVDPEGNTYKINDGTVVKFPEVYSLETAATSVRHLSLEGVSEYTLSCPNPMVYNRDFLCGDSKDANTKGALELKTDFYWYSPEGRTSFTKDWTLVCGREYLHSLLSSIYFAGAMCGGFFGGTLNDIVGRKIGGIAGYLIITIAAFAVAASPAIWFYFPCRFIQGVGVAFAVNGAVVRIMEMTNAKYRPLTNTLVMLFWSVGYLMTVLAAKYVYSWRWMASIIGFLYAVTSIPVVLVPESPRFLLVGKKDEKAAKASLKWLLRVNQVTSINLDEVTLQDIVEDKKEQPSFIENMRDFFRYPEVLIQMVLQMIMWMFTAFVYYGFNFSWRFFGKDIYQSYLFAALGELLSYGGMTFPIMYFGRKYSNVAFFAGASIFLFISLIPSAVITGTFTTEKLFLLIGSMFNSAAWGSTYLYTVELSPTSHRAKILGYCSLVATIGSICGPQAQLLLEWNKSAGIITFAVFTAVSCLCNIRLPRTKGVPIPNTAEEVQLRAKRGN